MSPTVCFRCYFIHVQDLLMSTGTLSTELSDKDHQVFDFLPHSCNDLFNGEVLAKRNGNHIILSVSQTILLLLHSLKKSLSLFPGISLSECASQNFCNFIIRHFFTSVHGHPNPFIESLLRLIQILESLTDDEYAYILAHVYLTKNIKNIYYNEIFPKNITSKNPFNYKSNFDRYLLISSSFIQCLYSNPVPTYFILDKRAGVILLSKSMCQELLWLLPIPFKRYTERVFKDFALLASYYFSKISEDDINESFERLKAVKRWEKRMQRYSVEDGLRAEIFLQFGQKMFKKMKKLEAMNDFIQSDDKVKANVLTRHFPRFQLNSGVKNLNLHTMTLRSAVLHRQWFIAAQSVQCYHKTVSTTQKHFAIMQSQISFRSTWLVGLQLLSMQENCINFDRKVMTFLEYMMKYPDFSKLEMQYDVYLWLLVKGYLTDACTLTVSSAKYLVADKYDLIFRALMVLL
ncbi:putative methyltransferase METT10D [Trichinella spiralis]|uniref:putative methyltransferase METT10D n=1 Tax=Trichinella spiralis TaxID=6334 RepID=UPI0001EFCC68|nr:putative methyltransferase METT10D [Trichinella spiralis]